MVENETYFCYFRDPSTFELLCKYSGCIIQMESDCTEWRTKPLHIPSCLQSFQLTLTEYNRYAHKLF